MSLSGDSIPHGLNPALMEEVLRAFRPHKHHKVSDLPDDIRVYHQNQDWFRPRLIETRENKKHQSIANRLGQEAHTPFSFASHGERVVFLVGIDFPTEGDQDDDNSRAMTLNRDHKFNQPSSLRDMMDVWIGILQDNDFDRDVARCLIYSSISIFDLIPITGASDWASKDPTGYDSVKNETTASNKAMLKNVIDMCPNVLGLLALGEAAYDGFPQLLEGTRISMINEERVMHPSLICRGWSWESTRTIYFKESVRMLSIMTGTYIIITEESSIKLIRVTKKRMNGDVGEKPLKKGKQQLKLQAQAITTIKKPSQGILAVMNNSLMLQMAMAQQEAMQQRQQQQQSQLGQMDQATRLMAHMNGVGGKKPPYSRPIITTANDIVDMEEAVLLFHEIVTDPSTDDCIHWLQCGTRFMISDKKKFADDVLPRFYGHAKFTSFTRQLKLWSFTRVPSGPFMGSYYNANFRRGEPELAARVMDDHLIPLSGLAMQLSEQQLKLQAQAIATINSLYRAMGQNNPMMVPSQGNLAAMNNSVMLQMAMAQEAMQQRQQQQQSQLGRTHKGK